MSEKSEKREEKKRKKKNKISISKATPTKDE
jgi:hypothetical protein